MTFINLAFNPMCRMNEVRRYSSVYQETTETLAEHVTEVSVMGYLIAQNLNEFGEKINVGDLLEKCLLHDIDEVITGDIPRNTKYASQIVHESLSEVATAAVLKIEETLGVTMFSNWFDAKKGKEGFILKIVDMLCVAKKSITEIELRGNLSFLKVVSELEDHLNHMIDHADTFAIFDKEDSRKLLRDLIVQAKNEITTIRVRYQHVIDKYHIKENVIKNEE